MHEDPKPANIDIHSICSQLINDIVFARSEEEVQDLVQAIFQQLQAGKTPPQMLRTLTAMAIEKLNRFSPMNKDAQQWSNIRLARICFFRQQQHLENVQT